MAVPATMHTAVVTKAKVTLVIIAETTPLFWNTKAKFLSVRFSGLKSSPYALRNEEANMESIGMILSINSRMRVPHSRAFLLASPNSTLTS